MFESRGILMLWKKPAQSELGLIRTLKTQYICTVANKKSFHVAYYCLCFSRLSLRIKKRKSHQSQHFHIFFPTITFFNQWAISPYSREGTFVIITIAFLPPLCLSFFPHSCLSHLLSFPKTQLYYSRCQYSNNKECARSWGQRNTLLTSTPQMRGQWILSFKTLQRVICGPVRASICQCQGGTASCWQFAGKFGVSKAKLADQPLQRVGRWQSGDGSVFIVGRASLQDIIIK